MTSKDRNDKNMDSTDDEDTNSTVVFADPCELIKNEPPIDIDVDAAEKAVADPSNSIMWRPSDEEATPNLDKSVNSFEILNRPVKRDFNYFLLIFQKRVCVRR